MSPVPCTPCLFRKSVVILLETQDQITAVMDKLVSLGYAPQDLLCSNPLLAIRASSTGRISLYFLKVDLLDALPADCTVLASDFLHADTQSLREESQKTLFRALQERQAKETLNSLAGLDVRHFTDAQLQLLQSIKTELLK